MSTPIKHVLVADDAEDLAATLAHVITLSVKTPTTTEVALNGEEAVTLAMAHLPAVAVLDLDMPVMNGVDAAWAIKAANPSSPPPLLIAITGNPFSELHAQARKVFDHVFIKPVNLAQLIRLVEASPG